VTVLRWQPAMKLGIPAIDADHKTLVGLLNTLHYALIAGDDRSGLGAILKELVDYTHGHFAREEALMERSGYPGIEAHRAIHRRIATAMEDHRATFLDEPDAFDMDEFYDFVCGWLLHHVLGEDMKLKPYFSRLAVHAA
jgi:hemerythrin-like metal-binding protein